MRGLRLRGRDTGGGPADDQYGADGKETIVTEIVPDEPPYRTSPCPGPAGPLLAGAGVLLACATALSVGVFRRQLPSARRRRPGTTPRLAFRAMLGRGGEAEIDVAL